MSSTMFRQGIREMLDELPSQDIPIVEPHVMNKAGQAVQREIADEVLA